LQSQSAKPSGLGTLFAHNNAVVLLLSIASGVRRAILGVRPGMTRLGSLLLAGLLFVVTSASAQSDDPSETFLKAYMTAQRGEKLERDNQFTRALAKYRLAGSLLEELKKTHSDWQPAIVEYRSRKVSESRANLERSRTWPRPVRHRLRLNLRHNNPPSRQLKLGGINLSRR